MCGIFGLIRNEAAQHPERASAVFVELGNYAIERGIDSAGFALTGPAQDTTVTGSTYRHVNSRETVIDNVHIIKDTCSFPDLWDDDQHLPLLARHRVALGHTRWATQGKRDALTNSSPLIVGNLVGTHNGDIDTTSVPSRGYLPVPYGTTDTEVLYLALNRDRRDRRKVTDTLRNIEGRAALAWVDRNRTDRVYLARAALSPLSIAYDAEGNLYWASNPRWFRDIEAKFNGAIGFHTITLVEEGVLLTVSLNEAAPVIEDMRRFTPKCRPSDSRLGDHVVWRGFDQTDCAADKAQKRHTVAPSRYSGWTSKGTKSTAGSKSSTKSGDRKVGGGFGGWDMSQPGYAPAYPAATSEALPDYTDRLDEIASRAFSDPAGAWAETDDLDPFWGDGDNAEELALLDEEEALIAANKWVEDGADDSILGAVRSASMPSEIEALMEEFDLSSPGAFAKFRDIVQSWQIEAAAS